MIRVKRLRPLPSALATAPIALAIAAASPLAAQEAIPAASNEPASADPRLRTEIFDPDRVFVIQGKVRVQTTISFSADEAIENVAIGDSNAWQVQPNQARSILFVKPLDPSARTNMTVVTNRRTYLFDLVASPRNQPLYVLRFRYPALEAAAARAERDAAEAAERDRAEALARAAAGDGEAVNDPALLNFAWDGSGEADLLPARAYDDGASLFLTWAEDAPVPAILVTNEKGEEGPVNFTVRGDTIVLDDVPPQVILRSGRESATLTNRGPQRTRSAALADQERPGS
ncbi:TrbG/VirB9 family P-type conjugative transfer protein [Qipengyuania nanhaisediminis]|uniref:TrbG/VirB9 family P-type conjugative transfer protein n=1 Tax=Qipengyuania nanhaisediminis TaxID=604088 RepID=UPI0038B3828F